MEAPKKLYISDYGGYNWHPERSAVKDIEYLRKDVFIERACKFIKERLFFEDSWHVEGEDCMLDKVIKDFKAYVEGDEI